MNHAEVGVPRCSARRGRTRDVSPEHLNELGSQGWEAVGLTLKKGDLVAWPVVLLKRPVG